MITDPDLAEIGSRWRHKKRGTEYEIISNSASLQCASLPEVERRFEDDDWTVYRSMTTSAVYIRLTEEFLDGRFERISHHDKPEDTAMPKTAPKTTTKHEMALMASGQFSAMRAAGWTLGDLIAAGWTLGDLRAAGWTLGDLIAAGWTPDDLRAAIGDIPLVERPYSRLLADIKAGRRQFKQSTFGPNQVTEDHLCKTAMCTAGHLINMAGKAGWTLQQQVGYVGAASLIHEQAHPGWPCQNFDSIPDEWALAYIEEMAAHEEAGTSPVEPVVS